MRIFKNILKKKVKKEDEITSIVADKFNSTKSTQKCNEIKIEVDSNVLANTIIDTIKNGRVNK